MARRYIVAPGEPRSRMPRIVPNALLKNALVNTKIAGKFLMTVRRFVSRGDFMFVESEANRLCSAVALATLRPA